MSCSADCEHDDDGDDDDDDDDDDGKAAYAQSHPLQYRRLNRSHADPAHPLHYSHLHVSFLFRLPTRSG